MDLGSLLRLLVLSCIWGGSFLLMRIGAPVLGSTLLIELRVATAAVFLSCVGLALRKSFLLREHWRHFALLGLINSALPFLLFATAAKTLTASLLAILNATSPIWGALIGAVWWRTPLRLKTVAGMLLGVGGVAGLVGFDPSILQAGAYRAILLGLSGAFLYGIATNYAKSARKVDSFANAHGSMWGATLLLGPAVPIFAQPVAITLPMVALVLTIGILCSGIAYLLYFRLIADIGPASALTVTFLVPVFGVLWGHVFLGEPITAVTVIGAAVVIAGTALVTDFSPVALWSRRAVS